MTGDGFDLHYAPPEVVERAKDAYDPLPWRLRLWRWRLVGCLTVWIIAPLVLQIIGPRGPMRTWLVGVAAVSRLAGWAADRAAGRWA